MLKLKKPFIEIKDLSFSYLNSKKEQTNALDNVNFNITKGEFLAIVGPSGCGKTTLLNCLDGLLQPSSGKILINGEKVVEPGFDRAYIFQDPLLLPWRTVLGNIKFGGQMQRLKKETLDKKSRELVRAMHLRGFEYHYPHQLSGGMKQRVNIARALCVSPQILLLDEPFSNLDAQIREIMQQELLNIYDENKKTFIFITHSIDEAIFLADKIIVLTRHPGTVKKIINVKFKRPRDISIKDSKEFIFIRREIAKIIKDEIHV